MPKLSLKQIEILLDNRFEKFAVIVNTGFQNMQEHFDERFVKIESSMDSRFKDMDNQFEDVKLRLDQHAYDADVKHLKRRAQKIENHIGIEPAK